MSVEQENQGGVLLVMRGCAWLARVCVRCNPCKCVFDCGVTAVVGFE